MRCLFVFACLLSSGLMNAQQRTINHSKLSYLLQQRIATINDRDSLDVVISYTVAASGYRGSKPFRIFSSFKNSVAVRIKISRLFDLLENDTILFINEMALPKEELTTGAADFTLNRINLAGAMYPSINGDSVLASIKERLPDTTDIDLKGRYFTSGLEAALITSHASQMATIMAGGGNSSPFARGVATGARLTSTSFLNLFPETDAFYNAAKISVQNHSYGTVVENFYGAEAAAYDSSAVTNPALLQIFSAGNSGTTTTTGGPYANVPEMANLTGNFKQSKNTVTVNAIDSSAQALPLSSKGPAYDGRIKPELTAYGEDGSSGAAALVSGTAVLVEDAYRKQTGILPPSPLTKAVLLNSADDVGTAGPDYVSGYGSLNAYKAVQTIVTGRFFQSNVGQGATARFNLTILPNTALVKLTLVWTDPPAVVNATKALVNDLDMVLKNNLTGEVWQPWVLLKAAVRDSLLQPARRGRDTLNNAEQITINNPVAGSYSIEITGSRVASITQNFAVAYQLDAANNFLWSYPSSADAIAAAKTAMLRWDNTAAGTGDLAYSMDGTMWLPVASGIDLAKKLYKWVVPDTSGIVRLRMTTGAGNFLSDSFVISRLPALQTGFNCPDSFLLFWNTASAAPYQLYRLGAKYLEGVTVTTDSFRVLAKAQNPYLYYAVAPLINGRPGIRSFTVNYSTAGVGCYLRSFFLQMQTTASAGFLAQLGTVYSVAAIGFQKFTGTDFITLQTITNPLSIDFNFTDPALQNGENRYRLKITLRNGAVVYSDVETVYRVSENSPVFFYPNPAARSGSVRLIAGEAGRYTIIISDVGGRLIQRRLLNKSVDNLPLGTLSKGVYFISVFDKNTKISVQKLLVY